LRKFSTRGFSARAELLATSSNQQQWPTGLCIQISVMSAG